MDVASFSLPFSLFWLFCSCGLPSYTLPSWLFYLLVFHAYAFVACTCTVVSLSICSLPSPFCVTLFCSSYSACLVTCLPKLCCIVMGTMLFWFLCICLLVLLFHFPFSLICAQPSYVHAWCVRWLLVPFPRVPRLFLLPCFARGSVYSSAGRFAF